MIPRLLAAFFALSVAEAALFDFPTKNRALLDGRPQDFYMYVPRDFEGQISYPWEGGQFGFVRGPQRTPQGVVFVTLHEGIDIQPLLRDPAGNPLDDVVASADGRVAHVSKQPGASNYGRYIVVEHQIGAGRFYSLYAHLASTAVEEGQIVRLGEILGRLGFSGAGIDKTRAHVHFEIGIMLSGNFESWFAAHSKGDPNMHGLFNGMNLSGTDPAAILVAAAKDPGFQITRHLAGLEPVFKITFPNSPDLTLLRNNPWLVPAGEIANPPAWTVSFTSTGFPVRALGSKTPVNGPVLTWVKDCPAGYLHSTRGLVGGSAGSPRLTDSGRRFAELLIWPPTPSNDQSVFPEKSQRQ